MRADGSSKFARGNRWGYFPSGSLAWAFARESFIAENASWLSNGKLRFSYGQTGNNRIGNYDFIHICVAHGIRYIIGLHGRCDVYLQSQADGEFVTCQCFLLKPSDNVLDLWEEIVSAPALYPGRKAVKARRGEVKEKDKE